MMFINVMNEDIFDVTFSIYLDNQIIRQQRMQAPRPFIEIKFIQTVQQIASQITTYEGNSVKRRGNLGSI